MPRFFLDENLSANERGGVFAQVLRAAEIPIELYKSHYDDREDDAIWIPAIARRGWIIVTADNKTRYRPHEKQAIVRAQARMLHLIPGERTTHKVLAQNFVNTYSKIVRFSEGREPPYIGRVLRPSKEEDFLAGRAGSVRPVDLSSFIER